MTTRHGLPQEPLRPFATEPGRWQRERRRIHHRVEAATISSAHLLQRPGGRWEGLVRIDEHTGWGWLRWQAPLSQDVPAGPRQIAVLPPFPSAAARLARRWLTRRPPLRIYFDARCRIWVTRTTVLAALVSFLLMGAAMGEGLPADIGVPLMLLIPALVDHLPERLDTRARTHVRIVQGTACRQMQRLVALHHSIQGASGPVPRELAGAVHLGHHLLWDAAGLLGQPASHTTPARLRASERLLSQLARLAAQTRSTEEGKEAPCPPPQPPSGPAGCIPSADSTPRAGLLAEGLVAETATAPMSVPGPSVVSESPEQLGP